MRRRRDIDGAIGVMIEGPPGPPGDNGRDGRTLHYGVGDPSVQGVDGDFYLDNERWIIFGPKSAGTWPPGVSLLAVVEPVYSYGGFAVQDIQPAEILMEHVVDKAHTLQPDFAGSLRISCGINPVSDWVGDVLVDDVPVGTATIANDGTVTLATVGGLEVPVPVGGVVTFRAPATPVGGIDRLRFTFVGVL